MLTELVDLLDPLDVFVKRTYIQWHPLVTSWPYVRLTSYALLKGIRELSSSILSINKDKTE